MKTKSGKSLSRKTMTNSSVLSLARLKKPTGGSYKVVSRSTKICRATSSKLFAWKAGTCKVSVTTYDKKGKKVSSKTVSIRVR